MQGFLLGALVTAAAGAAALVGRAMRSRAAEAHTLSDEMRKLTSRLDSLQDEVARTSLRADVAETVLLEKGVADEEEMEEARRYFEQHGHPRYVRERDGSLH
ncbi:MAG TPA: hypothetical protein VMK42_09180 [Anaeromyxobacteraceae bacterium]|nr:hypothetical protein [Anaeromyxobacteraceae bacterium]